MCQEVPRFRGLCEAAQQCWDAGASASDFEPSFFRVLAFIEQHPECRVEFESVFIELLRAPSSLAAELICYCMFRLRWPRVRVVAIALRDEALDLRRSGVMADVVDSFEDEWNGKDVYNYQPMRDA